MTNRTIRLALPTLAAAWLLALAPAAPAQDKAVSDTVKLADGKVEAGLIQSEEFTGLTLKGAGNKTTVYAWKDVRDTSYRQADEYVEAQQALQSGRVEEAEGLFRTLAADAKMRPVVRQQVLYALAVCLQQQGKGEEAAKALQELITAFPHGRFLGTASETLVLGRLGAKDVAGADAEIKRIETATKDYADFRPSLGVLKGMVLENQGKLAEAMTIYDTSVMAPNVPTDVKAQGDLGKARVLVLQKKPADAEAMLRKLVAQDLPGRVLGAAWNALGDIVLEQGRAAKDTDKILEAAFAYLRTAVQYVPLPGETTREYERGLAGAARSFRSISELEQNPERKELYLQRYRARKELLARENPESEFLANL